MGLSQGTWFVTSESDPRWNTSGEGYVGGLQHPQAIEYVERMRPVLGDPPDDLVFSYWKD